MAVEYSPSFFLGRRDDIVNNMASESRGRDFVSVSVMLKVKLLAGRCSSCDCRDSSLEKVCRGFFGRKE